ncbi:histidinol-phosphate aminotransferase family protein [Polaribacter haliotis]|uniref:Aminotransferase n=1 Tax=Polaribacter haliotis TaxID=1888915 RepID=A0A7L8AJ86_9FLAO|nr:histidinol-phosphate transaminase [Polaribacter haliotis]QOD62071.1 histidinol-phosphate aminotransferase family protein [Polaribacter haliotis]
MNLREKFLKLKNDAGSHSPSINSVLKQIPEIKIEVDACFLSNPYATKLFIEELKTDLFETNEIEKVLEYYPSQSPQIAKYLSKDLQIDSERIFIGNGAIEVIQAFLHNFVDGKIIIPIPTFSSYYEYIINENDVIFYKLKKEDDFRFDVHDYIEFVKANKPNTIVLINPNNPNGYYINESEVDYLLENLSFVENVIIDESFVHFAYEDSDLVQKSCVRFIEKYPNLNIIKSMSKDFGIAGIRAGYGIFSKDKVSKLMKNGFLWNINGLAEYFFKKYSNLEFIEKYELVRKKYIVETQYFQEKLQNLKNVKIYPSKANFVLIEILNGKSSEEIAINLLLDYGVYVRNCDDKIGLKGEFIRVASRSKEENVIILRALENVLNF